MSSLNNKRRGSHVDDDKDNTNHGKRPRQAHRQQGDDDEIDSVSEEEERKHKSATSHRSWKPSPEWRCGTHRYKERSDVLGRGGYGVVMRVSDRLGGPDRARKRQTFDGVPDTRLLFEIHALKMLQNNRGIVELIDICHKPGTIDIIMPIYWGTLQDLLNQEGRELRHGMARNFSLQLFGAVSHIHRKGLAHLDLKPGNLLLSNDGCIKIGDFGLAAEVGGPERTVTIGTVGYSAPECLLGSRKATFQADIWSTGCIVAEMFIGRPLFSYGDDGDETTHCVERHLTIHRSRRGCYLRKTRPQQGEWGRCILGMASLRVRFGPATQERTQSCRRSYRCQFAMLQLEPTQRPHLVTLTQHELFTEVSLPKKLKAKSVEPAT
ncbi:hypothetical protein CF319_g8394 [Tilletia indica]|nr:hypothetical protein CF319_g8394 [Tilletia indica]